MVFVYCSNKSGYITADMMTAFHGNSADDQQFIPNCPI